MDPIISAMPFMGDDGKIGFEFTSKYSSVVDVKLLQNLQHQWSSSNSVLNNKLSTAKDSIKLTADEFIHDVAVPISMTITNVENSFYASHDIQFVPNTCQWLEIEGG